MSIPVTLKGRMVADPELRFTQAGKALASFCVVTSRRVKDDASGQWRDADVSFHDCTAFGEIAENIVESCLKGANVIVTGQLKQEEWQTKEGENRRSWKVIADDAALSCRWNKVSVAEGAGSAPRPADDSVPF